MTDQDLARVVAKANTSDSPTASENALVQAFIQGAKWWEWFKTGATMWASDRDLAHAMALSRLADGTIGLSEHERIEAIQARVKALTPVAADAEDACECGCHAYRVSCAPCCMEEG